MADKKVRRHKRTKGVVLFTVVAIMFMLLIMIMATLAVVSSANRRTYTKFKENQAYFTARSGLESVTTALWNYTYDSGNRNDWHSYTDNSIYNSFLSMMYDTSDPNNLQRTTQYIVTGNLTIDQLEANSDVAKIVVEFPQPEKNVGGSNQVVNGDLAYLYGECTVYIQKTGLKTAKIISHSKLGDCESTVVLYTGPKTEKPNIFKNAVTTFSGAGADNMSVYGGTAANISADPSDPLIDVNYTNSGTTVTGSGYMNANAKTDNVNITIGESSWVVAGDFTINNQPSITTTYDDIKMYVGGKISGNMPKIGTADKRIDVYCDTYESYNGGEIYGDLYIFDENNAGATIKGTIHGNVYYMGTGNISFENTNISGTLYTGGTITHTNNLTLNGATYGPSDSDADIMTNAGITAPSDPPTKEEVLKDLPSLEDVQKVYAAPDGSGNVYNAWAYKTTGAAGSEVYTPYTPDKVADYKNNDNWVEWGGISGLTMENGYYVIDATTNDINYHVSASYSTFIPNDAKLMIKGTNQVNFYFDEGNYSFPDRSIVTNESILNAGNIVMSSTGTNNITLNTHMYFWGASNVYLNNNPQINSYVYAPDSNLYIATAGPALDRISGNISYDGDNTITNSNVTGIGSLVFNTMNGANASKYFYLPQKSDTPDVGTPGKFWQDLYYLNY